MAEIRQYLQWLSDDLQQYNSNLGTVVEEYLKRRRETALTNMNMLQALNTYSSDRQIPTPYIPSAGYSTSNRSL